MSKNNGIIVALAIIILALLAYIFIHKPSVPVIVEQENIYPINEPEQKQIPIKENVTSKAHTPQTIRLNKTDSSKSISVSKGDIISISLSNPGDGGYKFDQPKFNSTVLSLKSQNHINPAPNSAPGNFGDDVWQFVALETGTSQIEITASRPFGTDNPTVLFTTSVIVK